MRARREGEKGVWLVRKLTTDSSYRRRFVLTLSVCWSYVILGWSVLQIGTALPDLQQLVGVDLETAAWIFTIWSGGFMAGSLVSGRLFDHWNRLVIMLTNTIGMSACCFVIPYCRSVAILLVVRCLSGFFAGGVDTGANTIVSTIWRCDEGQTFMQALYLAYTLGGIFSPMATKPFMARSYHINRDISNGVASNAGRTEINPVRSDVRFGNIESSSENAGFYNRSTDVDDLALNVTNMITRTATEYVNNSTPVYNDSSMESLSYYVFNATERAIHFSNGNEDSRIHFAFMTSGLIVLSSAIPYSIMAFLGRFDERMPSGGEPVQPEADPLSKINHVTRDEPNHANVPKGTKLWLLVFVAGVNFMYSAIEDSLGDFLTTYCLFYLQWSKAEAVSLMSFYWASSCLGGLVGILVIKRLGTGKLLFLAYSVWNACFIVAVLGNITQHGALTWIGFLGAGFAMVSIIPATISWTSEHVCYITGKVSSVFLFSTGSGIAANPKFIGHMMEAHSYGNFVYVIMGETVVCSLLFVVAMVIFTCSKDTTPHTDGAVDEKC